MQKTRIYSMFKLNDGHITYEFNPGKCQLPIQEGTKVKVQAIGYYEDSNVGCYIYKIYLPNGTVLYTQPAGTLLHMTYYTDKNTPPVESGIRATRKGYYRFRNNHKVEEAIATYFYN